jgi:tetratricopeptide (TPR) repeat protein/tRNA A-37 threonylcarbamoyl transferase component Bud32
MGCPDENELLEYVEGRASPIGRTALVEHIDGCDSCRELVSALRVDSGAGGGDGEELPAGTIVGRYRILRTVGTGAMGTVYAADDPQLGRQIALKLLRPDRARAAAAAELEERLAREAQVLARLSSPHVVAVYDVGHHLDRVFIAMELVDGVTLGAHLRAAPRPVAEVVALFVAAGQGLAAAHRAGVVHRDFKPDNVLVGRDGSVRVTDFGLARAGVAAVEAVPPAESTLDAPVTRTLTETGSLVGTPAYMAPEQMEGGAVDTRADVFSFAVALWEGLYGERPFAGATVGELHATIRAGALRPPRRARRVPGWLRRCVVVGLAADPAARWPSMDAFLAALGRDPRRAALRFVAGAAAAVALAAGATGIVLARRAADPARLCRGGGAQLAGVWDGARRAALTAAFARTGRPYAASVAAAVARGLDGWAAAWDAMHEEACLATRARGEQSEELLDLRMSCLGDRKTELAALIAQLVAADDKLVDKAPEAVARLPRVETCADTKQLLQTIRPPRDPAEAARVAAARAQIAEARALLDVGRWPKGREVARAAVAAAKASGYRPVEAEAWLVLGSLENVNGDPAASEQALAEAALAGEAGRYDAVVARARTSQLFVVAAQPGRQAELPALDRAAEAAIERLGGSVELEAARQNHLATLALRQGKLDEATRRFEAAVAGFERAGAGSAVYAARAMANLTIVYLSSDKIDAGLALARRALARFEELDGPDHPEVAVALEHLVGLLNRRGRYAEAEPYARRALRIREAALGPEHPDVSYALSNLGGTLRGLGRDADALALHRRELALVEKQAGPDDPEVASVLDSVGTDLRNLGRLAEARAAFERGLRIRKAAKELDPRDLGTAHYNLGELARRERRFDEAARHLAEAERILLAALGAAHGDLATVLVSRGELAVDRGRFDEAVAPLERALAILGAPTNPGEPGDRAEAELTLARALRGLARPADEERVRALATRARDAFAALGREADRAAAAALLVPPRP